MMPYVGIKELKNQTTEILRGVREDGMEYVVTFHGRPVAVLLPIAEDFLAGEQRRAVENAFPSAQLVSELRAATPVPF
jgi:prevent-host-death family protein